MNCDNDHTYLSLKHRENSERINKEYKHLKYVMENEFKCINNKSQLNNLLDDINKTRNLCNDTYRDIHEKMNNITSDTGVITDINTTCGTLLLWEKMVLAKIKKSDTKVRNYGKRHTRRRTIIRSKSRSLKRSKSRSLKRSKSRST